MKKIRKGKFNLQSKRSSAGLGLFTQDRIPRQSFVIEYHGRTLDTDKAEEIGGKYLFEINSKKVIDGSPRYNLARYVNHSCRPNCETEITKSRVYIFSKRNIKEGEELCYDYGKEYFNEHIKPFGCKCNKCLKK